jgi:hypothetical protein
VSSQPPLMALEHRDANPPDAFIDRFTRADQTKPCTSCGRCTRGRLSVEGSSLPWCSGCAQSDEPEPLRLLPGGQAA